MEIKKRLVDARAGKKHFCSIARPADYNGVIHLVVPISEIDKLPTVDAVEVSQGRWIVNEDGFFCNVKCSTCGKDYACHYGMLQLQNFSYCPNCGAKMDGGSANG